MELYINTNSSTIFILKEKNITSYKKPDEIEDYKIVGIPSEDNDHLWIYPKRREFAEKMRTKTTE